MEPKDDENNAVRSRRRITRTRKIEEIAQKFELSEEGDNGNVYAFGRVKNHASDGCRNKTDVSYGQKVLKKLTSKGAIMLASFGVTMVVLGCIFWPAGTGKLPDVRFANTTEASDSFGYVSEVDQGVPMGTTTGKLPDVRFASITETSDSFGYVSEVPHGQHVPTVSDSFRFVSETIHDQGGFGKVYKAVSKSGKLYVIKRIMTESNHEKYLSGVRERYFGLLFQQFSETSLSSEHGLKFIGRFKKSYEPTLHEIFLVFHYEGTSLYRLMYTDSAWWVWLKSKRGARDLFSIMKQLLMAVEFCHSLGITHRDIKPDNLMVCLSIKEGDPCLDSAPRPRHYHFTLKLVDFGSSMDDFSATYLYGKFGPSS